jgi:hypothetical protein
LKNFKYWNVRLYSSAAILLTALNGLGGCTPARKQPGDESLNKALMEAGPLEPEEAKALLGGVAENWVYGQGMGETALTAGTILLFPPYAALVLGNAVLDLSGYETIKFSDALPEDRREDWKNIYDSVTSAPGQVSAAIAGKEFRTPERSKEEIKKLLPRKKVESTQLRTDRTTTQ